MHLPAGKSLASAAERGGEIGCRALQIFSGNPRGWSKPPLDPQAVAAFKAAVQNAGIDPVVVHATYLINLAAPDQNIYDLSVTAFLDELKRSAELGARLYVVHCGSHKGTGEIPARERVRAALAKACKLPVAPTVLLENTAGTSNSMGTSLHDLKALADGFPADRVGFCFDTCHALAAGFEIRTPAGVKDVLDDIDQVLGLARLRCLHLNDSKGDLLSRLDRHEHIGDGTLGAKGIQAFLSDPRLWGLPVILETPQDEDDDDLRDMRRDRLRRRCDRPGTPGRRPGEVRQVHSCGQETCSNKVGGGVQGRRAGEEGIGEGPQARVFRPVNRRRDRSRNRRRKSDGR
jgi:deoxyribonuclease-4